MVTPTGWISPLHIRNGLIYMDMRPPRQDEYETYNHVDSDLSTYIHCKLPSANLYCSSCLLSFQVEAGPIWLTPGSLVTIRRQHVLCFFRHNSCGLHPHCSKQYRLPANFNVDDYVLVNRLHSFCFLLQMPNSSSMIDSSCLNQPPGLTIDYPEIGCTYLIFDCRKVLHFSLSLAPS